MAFQTRTHSQFDYARGNSEYEANEAMLLTPGPFITVLFAACCIIRSALAVAAILSRLFGVVIGSCQREYK